VRRGWRGSSPSSPRAPSRGLVALVLRTDFAAVVAGLLVGLAGARRGHRDARPAVRGAAYDRGRM
jgi:hypothetical protein